MKALKYFSLFLLSFSIFNGNAQTGQDVGLTRMVYPVPNQQVHLQYTYDIVFIVKNMASSTSAVPKNAGMSFELSFDGVLQGNFVMNTHPKMDPGDSLEITIGNQSFSTPNPTIDVCVVVIYANDISKTNDSICNTLGFSVDNNVDLGPSFIDIKVPDVDSVITPGENIYLMEIEVTNFGTVTLPREDTITVETRMYNQTKGPFYKLTSTALANGETFSITAGGQQPKVQSNPGPFQICATLVNRPDDQNTGNDEYCQVFYAYDWTSVNELESNVIESYEFESELYLKNLKSGGSSVFIFDMSGRQVLQQEIDADKKKGVIDLNSLNAGVYIIKIVQNGELVHSNQFSID